MRTISIRLLGLEPLSQVIAFELSEQLSSVGAFALPRERDVILDLSNSPENAININTLVSELVKLLERLGLNGHYIIEVNQTMLTIRATSPKIVAGIVEKLKGGEAKVDVCPHCGFTTPYPEVMREHIKIHYLL